MAKRKALTGAGAASIAVMATLAGAPSAGAQDVCVICPEPQPGSSAFSKLAEMKFPGATEGVFFKQAGGPPPAFYKLAELGFPGRSGNVFGKE